MIPIYISYFAGRDNKDMKRAITNAIGFVVGFTIVFILLAVFASYVGSFISSNIKYIEILFGIIIIIFGLNYMELIKMKKLA